MSKPVLVAGPPGDMATRVYNLILEGKDFSPVCWELGHVALTGDTIKGEKITDAFRKSYFREKNVNLVRPKQHDEVLKDITKVTSIPPLGINFATADGFDVNFKFVEYGIPFISGVTGMTKKRESELVRAVENSDVCAVIDKNMSPALVLFGEMLGSSAEQYPNALEGFSGYGIDSHQKTKKDKISGTLLKWAGSLRALGVEFVPVPGDRTSNYGHGDHFMRIVSPDGQVRLTFQTEVLGRDTYAQGTVNYALPFLDKRREEGIKGKVYTMADVLKG